MGADAPFFINSAYACAERNFFIFVDNAPKVDFLLYPLGISFSTI